MGKGVPMDPQALHRFVHIFRFQIQALLLMFLPASALNISGRVVDKLGAPVPGARVCAEQGPERCDMTDSAGAFQVTEPVGIATHPAGQEFTLRLRAGLFLLRSPAAGVAVLSWHDAGGRLLAPARAVRLAAGENRLEPATLPAGDGIRFLRAEAPGLSGVWKAVWTGGRGAASEAATPAGLGTRSEGFPIAALAKSAIASSDLVVEREGFRKAEYRPKRETETGVVIVLTPAADTGITYLSVFPSRVLSAADGRMISESRGDTCNGTSVVTVTRKDTTRFALRGGNLLRWLPGECAGEVLTGGGSDLAGTWTLTEADFPLPMDLRPAGCNLDTLSSTLLPSTVRETLVLTDTTQVLSLSVEVCPADLYISLIDRFLLRDSAIALSANTCRRAAWRNASGEEAVLAFERRGEDSLGTSFVHKTTTCTGSEVMTRGEGVPVNCTGNDPTFTFLDCVAGTGFFGDAPTPEPRR